MCWAGVTLRLRCLGISSQQTMPLKRGKLWLSGPKGVVSLSILWDFQSVIPSELMWTDHGLTMAQSTCIWGRDCLLIGPLAWRCLAWQAEKLEVITCYNHDMAMAILIAHDLIYDSYMMVIWWLYHGQSVVIVRKNDYNKNHRLVIIQPYWLY